MTSSTSLALGWDKTYENLSPEITKLIRQLNSKWEERFWQLSNSLFNRGECWGNSKRLVQRGAKLSLTQKAPACTSEDIDVEGKLSSITEEGKWDLDWMRMKIYCLGPQQYSYRSKTKKADHARGRVSVSLTHFDIIQKTHTEKSKENDQWLTLHNCERVYLIETIYVSYKGHGNV